MGWARWHLRWHAIMQAAEHFFVARLDEAVRLRNGLDDLAFPTPMSAFLKGKF